MNANTLLPLLPLASLAACAAAQSDDRYLSPTPLQVAGSELIAPPEPCGVSASRRFDEDGRLHITASGDTVRPCQPLDAAGIANSCRIEAGELVYDPEHPNDERYARFEGPDYAVSDVQCANTAADGSEVLCDFTISDGAQERRVTGHAFRHVYAAMHDEISHSYMTYWGTREHCMPLVESEG